MESAAIAHPNIAFIKYWGNRDRQLRIPANGSISMNLASLHTHTRVQFDKSLSADQFVLNGKPVIGIAMERVSGFLDLVRGLSGKVEFASITSENNFPTGAGLASSASGFAALCVASCSAVGLNFKEYELSRLARRGSGSAARSIPEGFVEWKAGSDDTDSYALSIAAPNHWDLVDCIALVSTTHKHTSSREGHLLANTSPLQAARVEGAHHRLDQCRLAILKRDFDALAEVTELDSNLMHSVMMTSSPALFYWEPATLTVLHEVITWRRGGMPVCYTLDAGPNVHVICTEEYADRVISLLGQIPGIRKILQSHPGGSAHIVEKE
jgi:diphosphomevalonate decarboxylase